MELLVDQRDTLELGKIIPVGDLYDLVSRKFEPYSASMRTQYEAARKLLEDKFLPMRRETHGLTPDQEPTKGMVDDVRLVKTLILAALVPEVEALHAIDASRLAALNHGTFRSPVPNQEARLVLSKLQRWQAQVGELKVDEDTRRFSLNLASCDVERILEQVRSEDSFGNRIPADWDDWAAA
jgi:hypothetical protein